MPTTPKNRGLPTRARKRPIEAPSLTQQRRPPSHPGEMFEEEYRKPAGVSQAEAARRMGMSTNRLNEIVKGKRSVTADTALLFAAITGSSEEFWIALQANYDLWHALQKAKRVKRILPGEPFPVGK